MGLAGAGVAALGLGAVGSLGQAFGSMRAGSAMSKANQAALAQQMMMYQQTAQNVAPYIQAGDQNLAMLEQRLPGLTANFNPTMGQLEQTPGYQFTKEQGLQAAQNSYAAQGLGTSGAAMKGAANYAEGLASNTFQQQFQDYLSQNQQNYNMLQNSAQMGLAGSQIQAGLAGNLSQQMGTLGQASGLAQAQGTMGTTNALASIGQGAFQDVLSAKGLGLFSNTGGVNAGGLGGSLSANTVMGLPGLY